MSNVVYIALCLATGFFIGVAATIVALILIDDGHVGKEKKHDN